MSDNIALRRLRRRREIISKLKRRGGFEARTPYLLPVDVVGTGLEEEEQQKTSNNNPDEGGIAEEAPQIGSSSGEGDGGSEGRGGGSREGLVQAQPPEDAIFLIEASQKAHTRKLLRKVLENEEITSSDPQVE